MSEVRISANGLFLLTLTQIRSQNFAQLLGFSFCIVLAQLTDFVVMCDMQETGKPSASIDYSSFLAMVTVRRVQGHELGARCAVRRRNEYKKGRQKIERPTPGPGGT